MSSANLAAPSTPAWLDAFKALPRDTPIQILNLIRLRPLADYPPDHPDHGKGSTGLDAYGAYRRTNAEVFARMGLWRVWQGRPEIVMNWRPDERWDLAFIVEYPSTAALLAMIADPEYREHLKHRTAAVEDSRQICLTPLDSNE
ncbi:MAG TPA: DUF1330 domain-containing protein [Caulobacteraceae bacterium]|jgi:uncharacterized protein (DUF1330 family)|nr:DUF1330 domain-containing protein [Caulobacteraceae bacterium]